MPQRTPHRAGSLGTDCRSQFGSCPAAWAPLGALARPSARPASRGSETDQAGAERQLRAVVRIAYSSSTTAATELVSIPRVRGGERGVRTDTDRVGDNIGWGWGDAD